MEVGEQQLILANQGVFFFNRLFYLDNHLGLRIDLFNARQHLGTATDVVRVRKSTVLPSAGLDIDRMPTAREFKCPGWRQRYPVFIGFNLLWYSDNHDVLVFSG